MSQPPTSPEGVTVPRRHSFGTRLLLALVGLVVIVAGTMLLLIGRQTNEQVRITAQRAAESSRRAFEEVEELHRLQLTQLARAFTGSRRTLAALEAALESGDRAWLIDNAYYELDLTRLGNSLAAFTDAYGNVVVTLIDGQAVDGDPASIAPLARVALEQRSASAVAWRVIDDRLFTVTLERVELAGRAIGTVTVGIPVEQELARHMGEVAGVEVCFATRGRCVAGTRDLGDTLAVRMAALAGVGQQARLDLDGRRWMLLADEPGGTGDPELHRVIAVPLDAVLAPFHRIRSVVAWTGLAALALALGVGLFLSERLAQPVILLVQATRRIARGDLEVRVPVRSRDELGVLAGAFNRMAEELGLKERYRDVLKKVVSRDIAEDLMSGTLRLGGETRTVTVVFADIVGFTSLAESLPPTDVIAMLNECMTEWSRAIEEEGGVIDKYIGDALMAIFGAPIAHEDDPVRAVRAALRMQERAQRIRARSGRNVQVAIGISTGEAVAGNMGSPDRLNYTVVGDSVNLASRLCDVAGAGEILISTDTMHAVFHVYRTTDRGETRLKGMSRPVRIHAVAGAFVATDDDGASASERAAAAARRGTAGVLAAWLLALAPSPMAAQDRGGLPTLAGLGLSYMSPSGTLQIDWSGRLDVEAYMPQDSPAWLIPTTSPFMAGRLRLLTDVFVGDHIYGFFEIRADRGEAPADDDVEVRLEQAMLRVAPWRSLRLHVQAGKFALPFGSYTRRHHTVEDPLIRPPLAYDYRTLVSATVVPAAQAGFLNWKNEAVMRRPNGSPQVWNVPYPWGAMISAQLGPLALRAAAMSAAAASGPEQWDLDLHRFDAPTWVAGALWEVVPELRIGAAYQRGPYIDRIVGTLPAGADISDFGQETWNAEFNFARGRTTLRGEAFFDIWEVPNLTEDPGDISWYLELQQKLVPGLFLAGRWSEMRFDELSGPAGRERWDRNVRRFQIGAGYRLLGNTELRAEYLWNRTSDDDPPDNLFSLQWWWAF